MKQGSHFLEYNSEGSALNGFIRFLSVNLWTSVVSENETLRVRRVLTGDLLRKRE